MKAVWRLSTGACAIGIALLGVSSPGVGQTGTNSGAEPREVLNAMLSYVREQRELTFNSTMRLSGVINKRAEFQFHLR